MMAPSSAAPVVHGRYDVRSLLIGAVRDETGGEVTQCHVESRTRENDDPPPRINHHVSPPPMTGRVTGLVELVNKGGSRAGFTHDDERMLAMLCSHCSIFLKSMQ